MDGTAAVMMMISVFLCFFFFNLNKGGRTPIFCRQAGPERRRWGDVIEDENRADKSLEEEEERGRSD